MKMFWKSSYAKGDARTRFPHVQLLSSLLLCLLLCAVLSACGGETGGVKVDVSFFGTISSDVPSDDAARADGKTEILFFGDVQPEGGLQEYEQVGELIAAARAAYPDADFALQCGDITNTGDAPEEWNAFFSAAAPALEGLSLFLAPGNHESVPNKDGSGGKPETYLHAFELPQNGPEGYEQEYYSFDCGDVHVVSLSANYLDPSETYSADEVEAAKIAARVDAWLEDDLAGTNRPWKLVLMHQPAYPLVGDSTAAGMRERWIPIFDRTGVDLVLCGHQHEFMRTFSLKGGADDPDGLVQIMGNASQKYYDTSETPLPEVAFEKGGMRGYHIIMATPDKLSVSAYDADGRAVDYWEKSVPG